MKIVFDINKEVKNKNISFWKTIEDNYGFQGEKIM